MIKIKGIDKGTTFTKDNEGNIIRSTVKEIDEDILLNNKMVIEMNEKKYIIGESGNYSTDLMKANHENTKILVYTIIAMSCKESYIKTDIILGLPVGLYGKQKENMKKLFKNTSIDLKVNGKKKLIEINRVEIFPEAAGAFYTQSRENALILDFGGLSIDTALFENNKLKKYSTYSMGTMKLYSKLANRINGDYDLSLTEWDIPKILEEGLFIYGKRQNINVDDIIEAHILEIIQRLKLEYDLKVINNILLTGGGSILLEDYIRKYIPQAIRIESIFANAKGFRTIGEVLFK